MTFNRVSRAESVESLLRICSQPIYEGLLSADELDVLPECIEMGLVRREYTAWPLSMAKIVVAK